MAEDKWGGRTWLVLGSSPSAKDWFRRLAFPDGRYGPSWDHSITCNGGLKLLQHPKWCFILDASAVDKFADEMKRAKRFGTEFIAEANRAHTWERELGFPMDRTIETVHPMTGEEQGYRGRDTFVNLSMTGPLMAQFALAEGASRLLMVGFEGYRSDGDEIVMDYFDGRMGVATSRGIIERRQAPFFRSMIEKCPSVRFEFFGDLTYDLGERPNLIIHPNSELEI